MDNRKLIVASYIVASMVAWFLSRSAIQYFYLTFYQIRRLPGITFLREALPFALGATTFVILIRHPKVNMVLEEVVAELKKVTWPTRQEVVRSTTVVLICILIASFILAGFDLVWGKVITSLLKG
jgi:preprotein translocase SecE subunit